MQMEREALPTLLDWEKIAANADELVVYTIALEAIVVIRLSITAITVSTRPPPPATGKEPAGVCSSRRSGMRSLCMLFYCLTPSWTNIS